VRIHSHAVGNFVSDNKTNGTFLTGVLLGIQELVASRVLGDARCPHAKLAPQVVPTAAVSRIPGGDLESRFLYFPFRILKGFVREGDETGQRQLDLWKHHASGVGVKLKKA
jgi:hypothetical protein